MASTSIKRTLITISLIATIGALLVVSAVVMGQVWLESRSALLNRQALFAQVIGETALPAIVFDDESTAQETLDALRDVPGIEYAVLYRDDGTPFVEFWPPGQKKRSQPPPFGPERKALKDSSVHVFHHLNLGRTPMGAIYLRAETAELWRRTATFAASILGALMLGLLVSLALVTRLQREITTPVLRLAGMMREISRTRDYSIRSEVSRTDELGTLAAGFDDMIETIRAREVELERHRRTLEGEVQARTAELAATNEQLEAELCERTRVEQALQRSAKEWSATFDAISDGVCVMDLEGHV
ncbi:MAG: HAMP domain-containing protein, partial [Deltaproteobacteria bacterium]|nr:HAMP domain-containing protein [Deltaproteobacteria bacterium]